jgi:hypothetical protein
MLKRRTLIALWLCALLAALDGLWVVPVAGASTPSGESATWSDPAPYVGEGEAAMPEDMQFLPGIMPEFATGKWIDINLSQQRIRAYYGNRVVRSVLVSTGTWRHPTVVGRFRVYRKVHSQTMSGGSRAAGDYYRLPGVPHVMYFYSGYAIHGTYWHHNFGHRMSHGCVNLTLGDANWFYSWTPMRTLVSIHY